MNQTEPTQFKYPYERSGLDKWLEPVDSVLNVNLNELVNKSLSVFEKKLVSEDQMIRLKAATEILRYAKGTK